MNARALQPEIHLRIDSLVLHGFARIDEAALRAALQESLKRELLALPTPAGDARSCVRDAIALPARYGTAELASGLGQSLARAVKGGRDG
jgi:hypothetical protein